MEQSKWVAPFVFGRKFTQPLTIVIINPHENRFYFEKL